MILVAALLGVTLVAVFFAPPRLRLLLWTLVVIACVVPWASMQNHAHWWNIGWIPLMSPPIRLRDMAGNIALYAPIGWFFPASRDGRVRIWRIVAFALGLSLVTEATQIFSHGRFPSMTDVLMNVIGAWAGGVVRMMLVPRGG